MRAKGKIHFHILDERPYKAETDIPSAVIKENLRDTLKASELS